MYKADNTMQRWFFPCGQNQRTTRITLKKPYDSKTFLTREATYIASAVVWISNSAKSRTDYGSVKRSTLQVGDDGKVNIVEGLAGSVWSIADFTPSTYGYLAAYGDDLTRLW